nr:methyl-accepting chemotaxis protein [Jidongwangia harbinensis]
MADLSVNIKIAFAIGVAVLVAVAVGVTGMVALNAASESAQRISRNATSTEAVGDVRGSMLQAMVNIANHAITTDPAAKNRYEQAFVADLEEADAALARYRSGNPAGGETLIEELATAWQQYKGVAQTKQLANGQLNDLKAWEEVRGAEVDPLVTKINETLATLTELEIKDAASSAASARDGYRSSLTISIVTLIVGCLLALALGLFVARMIVRSLTRVKEVCDGLAEGDLTRTTQLTSHDEPGRMGQALDAAIVKLRETVSTIDSSASSLASSSEQMSGVANRIAASAQETTEQARTVSAAAEQISRSVDTVSAGSEEMGASIREISLNATEAAQVATEAVAATAATSATMNKLGASSAEIGNVVKVITAIAGQTNLLALNATIEAARAGEMGKGFAVVASEVKDLAQETARATEDISRRVEAIQMDTGGAVTAIEEITRVIARISDFQTTIASAVEEQTATTAEMNRSVSEAATGTSEIAENITGVAEAARLTSEGVIQTQRATTDLARMSTELTALVGTFRY